MFPIASALLLWPSAAPSWFHTIFSQEVGDPALKPLNKSFKCFRNTYINKSHLVGLASSNVIKRQRVFSTHNPHIQQKEI